MMTKICVKGVFISAYRFYIGKEVGKYGFHGICPFVAVIIGHIGQVQITALEFPRMGMARDAMMGL